MKNKEMLNYVCDQMRLVAKTRADYQQYIGGPTDADIEIEERNMLDKLVEIITDED